MQALLPCCWEQAMDGLLDLSLFLLATFAAALVAGLAGFAFGLVAAAVWLHILDPVQTAALIIGCGRSCSARPSAFRPASPFSRLPSPRGSGPVSASCSCFIACTLWRGRLLN